MPSHSAKSQSLTLSEHMHSPKRLQSVHRRIGNAGGRRQVGPYPYFEPEKSANAIGDLRENPYIDPMINLNASPALSQHGSDPDGNADAIDLTPSGRAGRFALVVPIRSLASNQRHRIAAHLLGLDPQDRYLRFGYAANDEQIGRYVASLDFEKDEVFGIFNRSLQLIAFAHLAYSRDPSFQSCAEFGVSVAKSHRGRGYGARLFERAAIHARNDGVMQLYIHALSENTPMLKIARSAGAVVTRDGSESDAFLRLLPSTLDSQVSEIVQEQLAQADYQMKRQAKHFRTFLSGLCTAGTISPSSGAQ